VTARRSRDERLALRGNARALLPLLLALLMLLALSTDPGRASAIVVKLHGHRFGVTPLSTPRGHAFAKAHEPSIRRFDEAPNGGGSLLYHGGPVMHSSTTHVIYWDPSKEFSETTKGIINKYFTDVAHDSGMATNVNAIAGQFMDAGGNAAYNSTSSAALSDTTAYPANGCEAPTFEADPGPYTHCLTDAQLLARLRAFIAAEKLPTGPTQFYAVLLPHKVVTCFEEVGEECSNNVYCAYHSSIEPGTPGEILYADIPFSLLDKNKPFGSFDAKGCQSDNNVTIQQPNPDNGAKEENSETRFADVAVKYISHEYNETITDPLGTAWYDAQSNEDGDKCNAYPVLPADEGEPGFDKNAFTPTLGGEASKSNLFNQAMNGDHFYTQSEWDNVAKACRMTPLPITGTSFAFSPVAAVEKSSVEFKGAATDPYGHAEFSWSFGDGSAPGSGATTSHAFAAAGEYEVTMTVKDGHSDSTGEAVKRKVSVDELPVAEFSTTGTGVKTEMMFNGSASKDEDAGGKIEKYTWEFGDKTTSEEHVVEVPHTYVKPGIYTATLTVEDSSKLTARKTKEVRAVDAPTVATVPATAVGQTVATLNAKINPNGSKVEECVLEYGEKQAAGGEKLPCTPAPGEGFGEEAISATVGNLKPATAYHFRIVAKGLGETKEAAEQSFTTLPKVAPTGAGESASSVTQTGAALNATVNPNGAVVEECNFEYGTSVFYEASVPCAALPGGGASAVAVSAAIGGLAANTTYHFRVVAISNAGRGEGADATFNTPAIPPPQPTTPATPTNPKPIANSSFVAKAAAHAPSGDVSVVVSVQNAGTLSWLATFANGKFGVFSASVAKCKRGYIKLAGKCRSAAVVFAKGRANASAAGTVTVTLKPSASARRALATARKRKKALVVTLKLAFQSSLGGAPTSVTITLKIKPKK
jgi:PKD repeat protein